MTINEAIKEFTEWAKNERDEMNFWLAQRNESDEDSPLSYADCGGFARDAETSAQRYEQLAEWLRELVAYKKIRMCGNCRHYVCGTTHFGECHVTSDIEPCVVGVNQNACDTFFDYKDLEWRMEV